VIGPLDFVGLALVVVATACEQAVGIAVVDDHVGTWVALTGVSDLACTSAEPEGDSRPLVVVIDYNKSTSEMIDDRDEVQLACLEQLAYCTWVVYACRRNHSDLAVVGSLVEDVMGPNLYLIGGQRLSTLAARSFELAVCAVFAVGKECHWTLVGVGV